MKLIFENIDPDQINIELIARCVVVAGNVLAPDDDFEFVIAGDFGASVGSRASDGETYDADRIFGVAAARALTDREPPVMIVNAGFVVGGADESLALATVEHEALHVLTARRGESSWQKRPLVNSVG